MGKKGRYTLSNRDRKVKSNPVSLLHFATTVLTALSFYTCAQAATFSTAIVSGTNILFVSGGIEHGDGARFSAVADSLTGPTVVSLNSDGGVVVEGIIIGEKIRSMGLSTAVPNNTQCASVCGLIWLAGSTHFIGNTGQVGFHAAYTMTGQDVQENGVGNALVGAYLTRLGLGYNAIAMVTSADPYSMKWLHPADAQAVGISVTTLADPPSEKPATAESARQPPSTRSPLEQRMINFSILYYLDWSVGGSNINSLEKYYQTNVVFYGASEPRNKVMAEKRKFSIRWPIRRYTIEPNSMSAQCSIDCKVSGIVDWDVASKERNSHSVGSANFAFRIEPNSSLLGGEILEESGSVISSQKTVLSSSVPSLAQANLTGLLSHDQRTQIGNHLRACYKEDTQASGFSTFSVIITVTLDAQGEARLADISDADKARAVSDPNFRLFAERALGAVLDPACAALPLPQQFIGKSGQSLTFRFRP